MKYITTWLDDKTAKLLEALALRYGSQSEALERAIKILWVSINGQT